MTVNKELLRRTLAYIEAHPGEWDQAAWRCGTTSCFAGHAAMLAGATWRLIPYVRTPEGIVVHVEAYAGKALGLPGYGGMDRPPMPHDLFKASKDLFDLRRIVAELCDGAE